MEPFDDIISAAHRRVPFDVEVEPGRLVEVVWHWPDGVRREWLEVESVDYLYVKLRARDGRSATVGHNGVVEGEVEWTATYEAGRLVVLAHEVRMWRQVTRT